jgi:hypothetical protein
MKKIIVFFAFAFSTLSLVAQSELPENETVDLKIVLRPASDTIVYNQFRDFVEYSKGTHPGFQQRPHFQGPQRPPFVYLPKPKKVIHKKDEVIVVYTKADYERLMMARKSHIMRSRLDQRTRW